MVESCHLQCRLRCGTEQQVTYLPQKYAEVGRILELRDEDGVWFNGWVVEAVFQPPIDSDYVRARSDDYRHQRDASDI